MWETDFGIGPLDLPEILHASFFQNSKNFFLLAFFREKSICCFFWHFFNFATHDIMNKNETSQKWFILHVTDQVARAIFFMCRAVSLPLMTTSHDMTKSQ